MKGSHSRLLFSPRCLPSIFDHRPHRARLLHRDFFDLGLELLPWRRVGRVPIGPGLQDADQPAIARHFLAVDHDRVDQGLAPLRDPRLDAPGVDGERRVARGHPHARLARCGRGRPGLDREAACVRRTGDGGEPHPFERTVGPVGERPGLRREALSTGGCQCEGLVLRHFALLERAPQSSRRPPAAGPCRPANGRPPPLGREAGPRWRRQGELGRGGAGMGSWATGLEGRRRAKPRPDRGFWTAGQTDRRTTRLREKMPRWDAIPTEGSAAPQPEGARAVQARRLKPARLSWFQLFLPGSRRC